MENPKIAVNFEVTGIDEAIEKASRLVGLLKEVQQIADSLFGSRDSEP